MIKASQNIFRFLLVNTRRKARQVFSSRDALSLILVAGLPFVMVSSFSINHNVLKNRAFAYTVASQADLSVEEVDRLTRQYAAQVKGNPAALLKLTGAQVEMMFSTPGLHRREGDMEFRQYRTPECVLDLYIAQNGRGDVMHYETRARARQDVEMNNAESRDCVRAVFNGHDGDDNALVAVSVLQTIR